MAENYTVNYQINVNSQAALESIRKFQEATVQMEALTKRFDVVAKSIGKVNSALASIKSKPIEITINTNAAETSLKRVLGLLTEIKAQAKVALGATNIRTSGTSISQRTGKQKTELATLTERLRKAQSAITNINRTEIVPKANVTRAIESLNMLLKKINEIKANGKLTITASAAGASKSVGTGSARNTTGTTRVRTTGTAGHSTYLYPSTRQVLGPTYANTGTNIAGEMVKGMGVAYGLSTLMTGITDVFRESTAYDNITQTTKNILETHDKLPNFEGRFDEMNRVMRQVGVETKYTAPEVAEAGKFLAMAGLNVEQIRDAIRPISDIALVGDTNLGETADVVTNIMTAYEIPSKRMSNAADILTMTFTKTNTTLMDLAESFKYAGTVAHQSGLDFETASAAFGVLGDAGIKGSHAGTTLRMMLLNMLNPTKRGQKAWDALGISTKDENGNLRNFADILSDLHEKQQQMGAGDFQTLINQMFRVTAAPGALALISNVGKMKEVVDLNKNSYDVASRLADEKKNTILGLWDQMTSAFTETGMQQFEAMQNTIRDFLKRMIALMESPEFAEAMRSMMDVFLKLVNVIVDVFKNIMSFWNWLPNWAKDGLVWFVKMQMTLSIMAGTAQSIWSTWIMIRGLLMGSWLSSIVSKFTILLSTAIDIRKNFLLLRAFGYGVGPSLIGAISEVLTSGSVTPNQSQINRGSLRNGTLSRISSGVAGLTPLSLLGKVGAFFATNPIGWGLMAAGAITGIGIAVYNTYKATEAARQANEAWGQSYRNLGIDKLNLSEPDALLIGNMRIFNNELLTQNERIAQSAELWHRYWVEKNGPQNKVDDITKYAETKEGEKWAESLKNADQWFGVDKAFNPLIQSLGGQYTSTYIPDYSAFGFGGSYMNEMNLFGRKMTWSSRSGGIDENAAVQLALAQIGADPNNTQRVALEQYLLRTLTSAHNYQDALNIIQGARKNYVPTKFNTAWDWISSENAEGMTLQDIQSSRMYVLALQYNMEQVFKTWRNFASLIKDAEEGNTIDPLRVQQVLEERFGLLFDTTKGLFGTNSWATYIQDIVNNPTKYKFDSVKEATGYITTTFDQMLSWYNLIDARYRPLFAQFLERTPYANALPQGFNLPEGGVENGKKIGDQMTIGGKVYTWKWLVPSKDPHWYDEDGNIYSPSDAKSTTKWSPTNDGSGSGMIKSLHNGADQSQYKSHYDTNSAAPKQVIVRIENLMRVDRQTIDMTDDKQVAALNNVKQQLATALLDVVQDFNANII